MDRVILPGTTKKLATQMDHIDDASSKKIGETRIMING